MNFETLKKIDPRNAAQYVPKKVGIYFWFDNATDELVYIGIGAGSNGLYNRIVRQHLNPKYIEFRSEKHSSKDSFQLSCPVTKIVKGELKAGIDQSVFRKNIARQLKLKPGNGTVSYILDNLTLKIVVIENLNELKSLEKELILKHQPIFNNANK